MNKRKTACWEKTGARRVRWGVAGALSVLLLACGGLPLAQGGGEPEFSEYEVKAAYLPKFMEFVVWPAGASTNAEAPLLIGVLGEDPFGKILEKTIKGDSIHGRPLAIKRNREIAALKDCDLIFICRSEKTHMKERLDALRECSALTVSDAEQFCQNGGMIEMMIVEGRVGFDINETAAEQSGLKISSKLLRLRRRTAK